MKKTLIFGHRKPDTDSVMSAIALSYLKNGPIKIEFKESNPYFNRSTIESKLESIHKLLNKEQILIDDIVQKGSYFSILWSGANYNNINTSFLSFYSLDFNYVGSLIMRKAVYKWLSCFSIGNNNYKDFRNEYIEKIKTRVPRFFYVIKMRNILAKNFKICNNISTCRYRCMRSWLSGRKHQS